jgi:hypothetical protein
MLDGAGNGQAGSNYVTVLNQKNLVVDPPKPARSKPAALVAHALKQHRG